MSNRALVARFDAWRQAGEPLALATVIHTLGSTYSKAGRQILLRADGAYAGLVSGGCLEGDLAEHARKVIQTGKPVIVTYDMRTEADDLWGMGLGCSGLLRILLQRLSAEGHWQPFADIATAMASAAGSTVALVTANTTEDCPTGTAFVRDAAGNWNHAPPAGLRVPAQLPAAIFAGETCEVLCWQIHPWPRLLLLGAGPDTHPLLELARTLGWECSVADHRPHYLDALPPGLADNARHVEPARLAAQLQLDDYSAVIGMSHHLDSDRHYLQQLAAHSHLYVGLLGPVARKLRLLDELGLAGTEFAARLRGPAGLAIGADTPATIALAILGEIQALLHELNR